MRSRDCGGTYPQGSAGLLDDVDGLQIRAALEAHDSVYRQLSKVILVMSEDLAAQRGPRDV